MRVLKSFYRRLKRASIRMHIDANSFIDIYCNTENGRFDFSLIRIGKRIFGYDNLSGWHYHPADNPECHIYCEEPDMRQIFEEIASVISSF